MAAGATAAEAAALANEAAGIAVGLILVIVDGVAARQLAQEWAAASGDEQEAITRTLLKPNPHLSSLESLQAGAPIVIPDDLPPTDEAKPLNPYAQLVAQRSELVGEALDQPGALGEDDEAARRDRPAQRCGRCRAGTGATDRFGRIAIGRMSRRGMPRRNRGRGRRHFVRPSR